MASVAVWRDWREGRGFFLGRGWGRRRQVSKSVASGNDAPIATNLENLGEADRHRQLILEFSSESLLTLAGAARQPRSLLNARSSRHSDGVNRRGRTQPPDRHLSVIKRRLIGPQEIGQMRQTECQSFTNALGGWVLNHNALAIAPRGDMAIRAM